MALQRDAAIHANSPPTGSMRHVVEFRDRVEIVDPRLLRANKYLPAWHQFISLAKRSKAHVVGFWLIAGRCGIDRRPAVRAESLHTDVSTIGGLSIFRAVAGQKHQRSRIGDNDRSQWSAAHDLAVCAVANGHPFGIGFDLECHVATVTASINFHNCFPRLADRGWMVAVARPDSLSPVIYRGRRSWPTATRWVRPCRRPPDSGGRP